MKSKLITTRLTAFIVAFALLAFVPGAIQPANASLSGARHNAAVLFNNLRAAGWEVRDTYSRGLLQQGESTIIPTTLYAGNVYKIAAAGCEDGFDVDIAVFDEDGDLVSRDSDNQQLAVADVRPIFSGTYYIRVTMYDSTANGAHYVVQYAFK